MNFHRQVIAQGLQLPTQLRLAHGIGQADTTRCTEKRMSCHRRALKRRGPFFDVSSASRNGIGQLMNDAGTVIRHQLHLPNFARRDSIAGLMNQLDRDPLATKFLESLRELGDARLRAIDSQMPANCPAMRAILLSCQLAPWADTVAASVRTKPGRSAPKMVMIKCSFMPSACHRWCSSTTKISDMQEKRSRQFSIAFFGRNPTPSHCYQLFP